VRPTLLSAALSQGAGRPALVHTAGTLTFGELNAAADRLALALAVEPGDRVAIVAPNAPALVVGVFAAWRAGAVAVPLSARLRRFELERAFADSEPVAAVSVASHSGFRLAQEIEALSETTPSLRVRVLVDESGTILDRRLAGRRSPAGEVDPAAVAIMYTSGTTGEPKGALMTGDLIDAMGRNLAEVLGEDAGAPYVLAVPASHAFGLGCLLCGIAGAATALLVDVMSSLDPLVQTLRRSALLHGSPALFGRLLRSRIEIVARGGFVAGSSCPPDLLEALDRQGTRVLNLYGMTELGAVSSCRPEDPSTTRYHTVGRPLPGYELRCVEDEIQVRSQFLPEGYHRRPWRADEVADGGWFRTGDLGELDADGNLIIAGRAKEVINVGGFNVFPAEVEGFLQTHPAILQAAVVGVPHPVLGEALQAFVTPAGAAPIEPREVIRFARAGIAGYKVPYVVRVVEEIPLLPSGKPDRRALTRATREQEVVGR
jgi:acyl-CoA synthetase (AMP-forming)/AMP-acid ligase II